MGDKKSSNICQSIDVSFRNKWINRAMWLISDYGWLYNIDRYMIVIK